MIDWKTRTEYQNRLAKLVDSREWLEQNLSEIQGKYEGKWIGIVDQHVVAVGETAEETKAKSGVGSLIDILIMRVPVGEISKPI